MNNQQSTINSQRKTGAEFGAFTDMYPTYHETTKIDELRRAGFCPIG